jgi:Cysteine rich repeat
MKRVIPFIIAVFCMSLLIGIKAYAEDTRPCADDAAKFCKDVQPGGGRMATCLKEHQQDLTPACRQRTERMMMRAKEMHKACADDVDKFCKDVQPGKGQITGCLRAHKSELSAGCSQEFGQGRHRGQKG